jgi:multiple sugar transport system substrate-binding protein
MRSFKPTRRRFLKASVAASTLIVGGPAILRRAVAQDVDLTPYKSAKIDWQQASGETITVAVIPASYFENLITIAPQFKALTGIDIRFEKIPPAQIRQKCVIDLTSKTGTYATHAADPMYYSLYAANKWVEPLDSYLADKSLTDADWFKFDDIIPAWRNADSVDGKLYGVPYDGEVTIQVYRKDLYDAKGLKPADDLKTFVSNAAALNTPNDRIWGAALRGVAGAGQNMYIYPSIFREFGGEWFKGGKLTVTRLVCRPDAQLRPDRRGKLELARHCRRVLAGNGCVLHRRAFVGFRRQQCREVQGGRQGRLCALA